MFGPSLHHGLPVSFYLPWTPNLAPGKTAAMLIFQGKGAAAARKKLFGPHAPRKLSVLTEQGHHVYNLSLRTPMRAAYGTTKATCCKRPDADSALRIPHFSGIADYSIKIDILIFDGVLSSFELSF